MSDKMRGFILILLAAAMGACIVPFAKIASSVVPPLSIVFWRVFIASLIFAPIAYKTKNGISLGQLRKLAPLSAILSLNITVAIVSVKFIPTSLTPIVYATTPLITYLIERLRKKKIELSKKYFLGMTVGFSGLLIATFQNIKPGDDLAKTFIGVGLVLLGAICFSFYGISSKEYQKVMSPIQISWINVIVASIILFPFAVWDGMSSSYLMQLEMSHVLALLGIALFGSVLAYLLYQNAIKYTSASVASLMTYIQPVFGVILSILLIGESITPTFLLGGTMALLGAYIASK